MKTVFNIFIGVLLAWILWICVFRKSGTESQETVSGAQYETFSGVRIVKTCKNYFSRPAAVAFDAEREVLYVSCMAEGDESDLPYRGYICKVSLYGEIIDTMPVPELREPKGLAVVGSRLYVADMNRVVRVDTETEQVDLVYRMPNAKYISDVVDDKDGNLYVSDTHADCIFRLQGDSAVVFCRDSLLSNVTGLCMDGVQLVAGVRSGIVFLDDRGRVEKVWNTKFSVYGIRSDGNGGFLVSDFVGNLHYVCGGNASVLQKRQCNANSADFEYLPAQKTIYMPTFKDNSLVVMEVGTLQ